MAYAKDINVILDKMKELNIVCYSITEPDGKTLLSENDNAEQTPAESLDQVQAFCDSIEGTVKITLRRVSKKERVNGGPAKDNHVYTFRCGGSPSGIEGMSNNPMFTLLREMNALQIEMLKKDMKHEKEMEDFKREIKEDDTAGKIKEYIGMLSPYIPGILSKIPNAIPIPGIAGNEHEEVVVEKINADQIKRLNTAVASLIKIDPDFVSTIEALAQFGHQSPEQYKSFIPMLKSQIK